MSRPLWFGWADRCGPLLHDLHDLVRARVNQNRAIIHHGVAILCNAILPGDFVIGHTT